MHAKILSRKKKKKEAEKQQNQMESFLNSFPYFLNFISFNK